MRGIFFLAALLAASTSLAGGHAKVGPFFAAESTNCSGDCGGALDEETARYGASALFVGRSGNWGGVIELAASDQGPQAGLGPAVWAGPVRLSALISIASDKAEYDLGGQFGSVDSTESTTLLSAEAAWHGVFARYSLYKADHSFSNTVNGATRSASSDMEVQSVWVGYRYTIW